MLRNSEWAPAWVPKDAGPRAYVISKMTEPQVESLHLLEIQVGRPYFTSEILQKFHVGAAPLDPVYSEILRGYAIATFPDATDADAPEENPECAKEPWYQTHAHIATDLACYHTFDRKVHRDGLPPTPEEKRERISDRLARREEERKNDDDPTGDRRIEGSAL